MRPALILCLIATPAIAQAPDTVSDRILSLETGVICPPESVGIVPAPGTVAGTTHLIEGDPPFVSTAARVPAVIGIGFGAKAMAAGLFGLSDVDVVVTHPPMGETGATRQTYRTSINAMEPSFTFYQFDYDYELLPGAWQIEAQKDGETLYRKTFEVVPPEELPALARICGFEHLLS